MKKKFFLVGALVAMSMSAMFIACSKNDQNTASDGCDVAVGNWWTMDSTGERTRLLPVGWAFTGATC